MNADKLERVVGKLEARADRIIEKYSVSRNSNFGGDIVPNLLTGLRLSVDFVPSVDKSTKFKISFFAHPR